MAGLGPLFGTSAIKGPIAVCYLQAEGRDVYLVGEQHTKNGSFDNDMPNHVVSHIRGYTEPVTVCSEFTLLQMRDWFFQCSGMREEDRGYCGRSPNSTYGYFLGNNSFNNNHKTRIVDSRKLPPYDIYTMIVDPSVYCFEHHYFNYFDKIEEVRKNAKRAEKAIIQNIQSRKDAIGFLESLYMPGTDYPAWYKDLYSSVATETLTSPLRDKMGVLKEKQPETYRDIVAHMRSYYQRWARTPYSLALKKIEEQRHTFSPRMVRSTHKTHSKKFIELYMRASYLLDLNFLLEFYMSDAQATVLIAGLEHVVGISRFFGRTNPVYMKADVEGNIAEGPAVQGVPEVPNRVPSLLKKIAARST